jgi:hypothetical protein
MSVEHITYKKKRLPVKLGNVAEGEQRFHGCHPGGLQSV